MTDTTGCYYDSDGCYVCPVMPAIPAIPYSMTVDPNLGWNAGANSVETLSGDVHVIFDIDTVVAGIVVGFKDPALSLLVGDISLVAHGLYVFVSNGGTYAVPIENNAQQGPVRAYTLGTGLEVRRVGPTVTYWINNVLVRTTRATLTGPVLVTSCLYSAGDVVP